MARRTGLSQVQFWLKMDSTARRSSIARSSAVGMGGAGGLGGGVQGTTLDGTALLPTRSVGSADGAYGAMAALIESAPLELVRRGTVLFGGIGDD
jgi:hypothetical protein